MRPITSFRLDADPLVLARTEVLLTCRTCKVSIPTLLMLSDRLEPNPRKVRETPAGYVHVPCGQPLRVGRLQ